MSEKIIESDELEFEILSEPISGLFMNPKDGGGEAEMTYRLRDAWMTTYAYPSLPMIIDN